MPRMETTLGLAIERKRLTGEHREMAAFQGAQGLAAIRMRSLACTSRSAASSASTWGILSAVDAFGIPNDAKLVKLQQYCINVSVVAT
jgi:hypothetical protein